MFTHIYIPKGGIHNDPVGIQITAGSGDAKYVSVMYTSSKGRTNSVATMSPDEADEIGLALIRAAAKARS